MADTKISALSSGAPAQAGDEYVVARSGANYKLTLTNIAGNMPATTISSGNLTFSSTGQRITGDFSNATLSNRLAFQTSTTNGNTIVGALPNGTGSNARLQLFSASDPANASTASMEANATSSLVIINADKTGTGTYLPMTFYTGGSERMRLDTSGNLGIGTASPASKLDVSSSGNNIVASRSTTGYAAFHRLAPTGQQAYDFYTINGVEVARITADGSNFLAFSTGSGAAERMRIDSSGKITDQYGNIRAVPQSGSDKTTSYTLATTDVGRFIGVGSGGSITVPNATFSTGDVVSIFNNTSGNVTLTMSITTAYIGGTDADKATITLATRGIATILFISGTVCVVNGNVS